MKTQNEFQLSPLWIENEAGDRHEQKTNMDVVNSCFIWYKKTQN